MFNSYEMTKAFVTERQETLRHEARQHHLAKGHRHGRGSTTPKPVVQLAAPAPPATHSGPDHLAA